MQQQPVVEARRRAVVHVCLGDDGLDAVLAQGRIPAGEALEELHARGLEPHEVVGVVGDALGVGLGEAYADARRERERPLHGAALYGA